MATGSVQAVVLAAGRAKRFNTATSKLLATICGQEMVLYGTQALAELKIPTTLVIGYQGELVRQVVERFHGTDQVTFVTQERQEGTGHAVLCTRSYWQQEHILVLNGDMPLVTPDLIKALCDAHIKTNATVSLVVAHNTEPSGAYGRIVKEGNTVKIVEAKEFTADINDHPLINAGIYLFKRSFIEQHLPTLEKNKTSNELYITDLVGIASRQQEIIATVTVPFDRVRGINTLKELWTAEQIKRSDIMTYWMLNGIRFTMPHTCHIDVSVRIGAGTVIDGNVSLNGTTSIGQQCHISANCVLTDAIIADQVSIAPCCVITKAHLKTGMHLGPFSHVHQESVVGKQEILSGAPGIANNNNEPSIES
jgi:bifunctional UDP-N-acetylglucosamine pyrophosphorylase / glucosamine-1-phosphate N-acetyltransferase